MKSSVRFCNNDQVMIAQGTTIDTIVKVVDPVTSLGNDLQANPLTVCTAAILGISQNFRQVRVSERYHDCSDTIWRKLVANLDRNSGRPAPAQWRDQYQTLCSRLYHLYRSLPYQDCGGSLATHVSWPIQRSNDDDPADYDIWLWQEAGRSKTLNLTGRLTVLQICRDQRRRLSTGPGEWTRPRTSP